MTREKRKTMHKIQKLYRAVTGKTLSKDLPLERLLASVDTIMYATEGLREETLQMLDR